MMKKLLGSTLVLALLFPSQVSAAALLKNTKFSGQIDIQTTSARNITDFQTRGANDGSTTGQDRIGDAQNRIMVSIDGDLLDDVHARSTIRKNNRVWGNASQDLNAVQTTLFVDEANIKIDKVFGALDSTFGRQFFGQSGDIIAYFGPSDKALWGMGVSAIDAARFDWSGENMTATILAGKADINTATIVVGPYPTDHQDIRALILSCKGQGAIKGSAYVWNRAIHRDNAALGTSPSLANSGAKNDNLYIAGVKAKANFGPVFANAEFAKNFGTQRDIATAGVSAASRYTGWAIKADGGYKLDLESLGAITPWAMLAIGTGRQNTDTNQNEGFTAINPDFRPGNIYGRFAVLAGGLPGGAIASNSLSNRQIWGIGLKVTPAAINKLTAGVSWYNFRFHRFTQTPGVVVAGGGNKQIGSEADLDLEWKHSENVSLMGGVGTFQPGGYIKEIKRTQGTGQNPVSPATLAYFDVRVKFGGN